MTYQETLQYLYASQPAFHLVGSAAYKPGLQNTYALMEHLGNPHNTFKTIHIAGTNGKGSVSHLIAASLQAAGLKTGLYTSPHLVDFRERIRINGQMIPEDEVIRFVNDNKEALEQIQPSFFETTMAMAFHYFAKEKVDIAVIETGLGGRLDSTNIITPLLSVITNIGLDHTEFLGNTKPLIANEKAGIIKPNIPCVIGETDNETAPVFINKARECGILGQGLETDDCRLWFADQCEYLRRQRHRHITQCQLKGLYQEKNCQTAYVALQALRKTSLHNNESLFNNLTLNTIAQAFTSVCTMTGLRGRWETLQEQPLIICDTGHNSHGIRYVAQQLNQWLEQNPQQQLHIVFGMVDDKDVDTVMTLLPANAQYYFTQAQTHRAIPAQRLAQLWHRPARTADTVQEAIQTAQQTADKEDMIFIGGSNYVVGEAIKYLSD